MSAVLPPLDEKWIEEEDAYLPQEEAEVTEVAAETGEASQAETTAPPLAPTNAPSEESPPGDALPLLTADLLRSLTLEDLMLLWILLMLLTGNQEDQIYLLLGLLLLQR